MKFNSHGMSIVSTLVAVAIGAILISMLGILYQNISRLQLRAQMLGEVEGLMHLVQDILNDPDVCPYALRKDATVPAILPTVAGPPPADVISWNPESNTQPSLDIVDATTAKDLFGKIVITRPIAADNKLPPFVPTADNPVPPTHLAYWGQYLAPSNKNAGGERLILTEMILREPNSVEGGPTRSTIQRALDASATSTNYTLLKLYAAKIEFRFQGSPRIFPEMGGALPPRTVNLTVGLDPNDGWKMKSCFTSNAAGPQSSPCDPSKNLVPCPPATAGCKQFLYLKGITAAGQPVCGCSIICSTPPIGPPGPHVSGGSGGEPGGGGGGKSGGN